MCGNSLPPVCDILGEVAKEKTYPICAYKWLGTLECGGLRQLPQMDPPACSR